MTDSTSYERIEELCNNKNQENLLMNKYIINSENQMLALAGALAKAAKSGLTLFLEGPLGAGKTTFARGFLRGLGYEHKVKSPTYTLVEPYELNALTLYHFDLYRLNDPEEFAFLGAREYFSPNSICLVEWPEKGEGWLPAADIICRILIHDENREVLFISQSVLGSEILSRCEFS